MKKFYVLLSVMVLALMTAGFSYAYWSDTLTVNGTAETGILDVDFENVAETGNVDYLGNVGTTNELDWDDGNVTITLDNLYPGAVYEISGTIKNYSTIPVNTLGFAMTGGDLRGDLWYDVYDWLDVEFTLGSMSQAADEDYSHSLAVAGATGDSLDFTITISVPATGVVVPQDSAQVSGSFELVYGQFNDPSFQ